VMLAVIAGGQNQQVERVPAEVFAAAD